MINSINQVAEEAWLDYSPEWFPNNLEDEQMFFHLGDMEKAFIDAFILGVTYFITQNQAPNNVRV